MRHSFVKWFCLSIVLLVAVSLFLNAEEVPVPSMTEAKFYELLGRAQVQILLRDELIAGLRQRIAELEAQSQDAEKRPTQ